MVHKHTNWPFAVILLLVGFLYFTLEVVMPWDKEQESFNTQCEKAGGIIIDSRNYPDLCFKKEILIEIKR